MSDTALMPTRVQEGGLLGHPRPIGVVASELVDTELIDGKPSFRGGHNLYTAHCYDCDIFFKFRFYPDPLNITMVKQPRDPFGLSGPLGLPACPSCKQHLILGT